MFANFNKHNTAHRVKSPFNFFLINAANTWLPPDSLAFTKVTFFLLWDFFKNTKTFTGQEEKREAHTYSSLPVPPTHKLGDNWRGVISIRSLWRDVKLDLKNYLWICTTRQHFCLLSEYPKGNNRIYDLRWIVLIFLKKKWFKIKLLQRSVQYHAEEFLINESGGLMFVRWNPNSCDILNHKKLYVKNIDALKSGY